MKKPPPILLLILFPLIYSLLFSYVLPYKLIVSLSFLFYFACALFFLLHRRKGPPLSAHTSWILIPFFLFCIWGLARVPFSEVPMQSLLSMIFTCGLFLLLWLTATFLSSRTLKQNLLRSLFWIVTLLAVYEFGKRAFQSNLILWYLPSGSNAEPASTFGCANHFAYFLEILTPFLFVFSFFSKPESRLRIPALLGLATSIPALLLTHSRAGIMGTLLALTTTGLALIYKKNPAFFKRALWIIPTAALLLLGLVLLFDSQFRHDCFSQIRYLFTKGVCPFGRLIMAYDTLHMISAKPWFGHGPGTFISVFPRFRQTFNAQNCCLDHPHNEFLECIAEFGWVGGIMIAWGIVLCIISVVKQIRNRPLEEDSLPAFAFLGSLAGTLFHSSFDFQLHQLPNALTLMILAGISLNAPSGLSRPTAEARKKCDPALFLLIVLLSISLRPLLGTAFSSLALFWESMPNGISLAESYYRKGLSIDPKNWMAHTGLGIIYRDWSRLAKDEESRIILLQEALRHGNESLRINPFYRPTKKLISLTLYDLGFQEKALNVIRDMAWYEPYISDDFYLYGLMAYKMNHFSEAAVAFWKAQSLENKLPNRIRMNSYCATACLNAEKTRFLFPDIVQITPINRNLPLMEPPFLSVYEPNTALQPLHVSGLLRSARKWPASGEPDFQGKSSQWVSDSLFSNSLD